MLKKFNTLYLKEQFNPKMLGLFINPFYFSRKGLYQHVSALIGNLNGKLLDIGCGSKPYKDICKVEEYIGLEVDSIENRKNKKADYFYDGNRIPFKDKSFDSLLSNQVFEHVFNPNKFLKELNRITKMGGCFL